MFRLPLPFSVDFPTISPSDHPFRSLYTLFFGAFFTAFSLRLLQNLRTGVTLISLPKHFYFPTRIVPGRVKLTSSQKSQGYVASYNSPFFTAVLGLLLYAAAQILIVLMFKGVDYTF